MERGCRHSVTGVRHGPDRLIALVVFVAFPRGATNVQIRVRGSRKHHPSAFVANRGRKDGTNARANESPREDLQEDQQYLGRGGGDRITVH